MDFNKIETFCSLKDTLKKTKKDADQEKYLRNISDKVLVYRTYKEFFQLNKKTSILIKNRQKI